MLWFYWILTAMVAASPPAWRFVTPAPGDSFEHPPLRALRLDQAKPDDLLEAATYRGEAKQRKYGSIRFGSPGSVRVTVVLDQSDGVIDLYIDADRNRKIDARDLVKPDSDGRLWRLPLDVAMVEGEITKLTPRAVVFRLSSTGRTLSYASTGYLEGEVVLNDQTRVARRIDGDGNGLLTDPQDRLWIDLNGDGRWDSASEQFLFSTVLNLEGARCVLRSDLLGTRLAVEPIVGTGTVKLATATAPAELRAVLVGRDSSIFGVDLAEPVTVPVGEYRLGSVAATYRDQSGGPDWSFVFSDNGARGEPKWYKVEKDAETAVDPIGRLAFEVSKPATAKAGADIELQPLLYTSDGLLINVAFRGRPLSPIAQENLGATLTLTSTDGRPLGSTHSGFA